MRRLRQGSERGRSAPSRSRLGVAGRLLVLCLLPLAVLAGVAVPLVRRARHDAAYAQSIDRAAPTLTELIATVAALNREQGDADAILGTPNGVSVAAASTALGVDLKAELVSARRASDQALGGLDSPFAAQTVTAVDALRSAMDGGKASSATVDDSFDGITATLNAVAESAFTTMTKTAASVSGSGAMGLALTTLGWSYDEVRLVAERGNDVAAVLLGPAAGRRQAAITLTRDGALFDDAHQKVAASSIPAVAASARLLDSNPAVAKYGAMVVDAEQSMLLPVAGGKIQSAPTPGAIDAATLGEAVRGIGILSSLVSQVVTAASRAVQSTARSLAATNTRSYQLWVAFVAVAAAVAAAVALLFARSISRPLGRVADTARAVVGGRLDVDALPLGGPRETEVVSDALNALVANLRLLETKTAALARCDFEDPVLAVPLPGRLGRALQDSVRVLSGSIHDRQDLQRRLAHQATHDTLTGLTNRAAAIVALDEALARSRRATHATALICADLDNFKRANDVYGHHIGDLVLRTSGKRLGSMATPGDIVARVGGDEFLIVAMGVGKLTEAAALARRVIAELTRPIETTQGQISVGASVGVVLSEGEDGDALELLARADVALDRAKMRGGDSIDVFDEALHTELVEQETIERDLKDAIAGGGAGLVLEYQPVIDTQSSALESVEALIRWDRPDHGRVLPADFIPLAETSDLIIDLDNWAFAAALRQLEVWSSQPVLDGLEVAINASGRHLLSGRLADDLGRALAASTIKPGLVIIEITETVFLDDLTVAATELQRIRKLGVKVAVDNFGTGYTSLAHLQVLPVDTIKIDRCFVQDLGLSNEGAFVRMITELGHQLGLSIIAEGVEAEAELDALRRLGADQAQGYLIARPMPPEQLVAWLQNRPAGGEAAGDSVALAPVTPRRSRRRPSERLKATSGPAPSLVAAAPNSLPVREA